GSSSSVKSLTLEKPPQVKLQQRFSPAPAPMSMTLVAIANDASALYWNPAGITQLDKNQVIFSHTEWPVDVRHEFFGYVHRLDGFNSIGVSITALHTDDIEETTEFQPLGTGNFVSFGDIAIGLTFARQMTDRFSIGATVKYIDETLAELHARNVFIDFGTFFWTGFGSSRFAVSVTNFGTNVEPSGEVILRDGTVVNQFQDFSPPTIFRIGFANDFVDNDFHKVTTSVQLNHLNDNAENVNLGVEYWWSRMVALRGGYRLNVDEESFAFGGGVALPLSRFHLDLDVSYTDFGRLGSASRLSASLKF
ncbi:PorV/PorQ family protein, partial [bacterium]|nr:PorV/PorQ family protein [bacterium]